jgi:energy-coupling factor transporter ATP-binding protein EcfA2
VVLIKSAHVSRLAGKSKPTEIIFNEGVNVIWGLNGSGKTTFLKILTAALRNDHEPVDGLPFAEARVVFYSETQGRILKRTLVKPDHVFEQSEGGVYLYEDETRFHDFISSYTDIEDDINEMTAEEAFKILREKIESQEGWRTSPSDKRASGVFRHRYLPTYRAVFAASGGSPPSYSARARNSERHGMREREHDTLFAREIQSLWQRNYRDQLMRISAIQESGIAKILNTVISGSRNPEQNLLANESPSSSDAAQHAYRAVSSFFESRNIEMRASRGNFQGNYQKDKLLRQVVQEIVDVEAQTLEAQEPARRIEETLGELFTGSKKVRLGSQSIEVLRNEESIPVRTLSSGEKQILYILLETLLAGSGAIIIDEPELSMHVEWQRQLVETMQLVNPKAQIILATHSPEILASVSEEEIIEL